MWQNDIMTFRLAGKNAYLIGFIDVYSRYITALLFFRSQTAENVIETYRRAVGEYGVPKEMLTDNRRATTLFMCGLSNDRVKHIRSRPHHTIIPWPSPPMQEDVTMAGSREVIYFSIPFGTFLQLRQHSLNNTC
jgi:hypothetical protein